MIRLCARRVIFPGRRQPSIVTVNELNYCVRNGNRCTLVTIDTHLLSCEQESKQRKLHLLLSYSESFYMRNAFTFTRFINIPYRFPPVKLQDGDPWGNRTPVCGVRGRRLNRLTNGPFPSRLPDMFPAPLWTSVAPIPTAHRPGTPSRARTVDPLIKSQLLYQLS